MEPEIYYISDLHLFHEKLVKSGRRSFETVEDMHRLIARNWRRKVRVRDTVYILGDVGMYHQKEIANFLRSLPGRKILITGNHDVYNLDSQTFRSAFTGIHMYQLIRDKGREVVLFHYPMEEWEGYWAGSYHVHGHVHLDVGHLCLIDRRYNASVEENGYQPVTLDEMVWKRKASAIHGKTEEFIPRFLPKETDCTRRRRANDNREIQQRKRTEPHI